MPTNNIELQFLREMQRKMARRMANDISQPQAMPRRRDPSTLQPLDNDVKIPNPYRSKDYPLLNIKEPRVERDTHSAPEDCSSSVAYGSLNTESFVSSSSRLSRVSSHASQKTRSSRALTDSTVVSSTDKSASKIFKHQPRSSRSQYSSSTVSSRSYLSRDSGRSHRTSSSRRTTSTRRSSVQGSPPKSQTSQKSRRRHSSVVNGDSKSEASRTSKLSSKSHRSSKSHHSSKSSKSHHSSKSRNSSKSKSSSKSHHSSKSSMGRPTMTSSQIYGLGCYDALQSARTPVVSLFNKRQTLAKDMYDKKTLAVIT